ncbi:hypothetical protein [Actinocrispum wychmicini]|uniref:Uncharacterized protein n=1 Tax=Actinocrispum wychmicini TaxID=1213861 RepID=A0A4R2IMR3_9PSEU|nr:hypothetical protein [Actinocrispum wychmicini]TCO45248.1 hypothetical protein EV192_12112 [Actinocrispum wychmicini]
MHALVSFLPSSEVGDVEIVQLIRAYCQEKSDSAYVRMSELAPGAEQELLDSMDTPEGERCLPGYHVDHRLEVLQRWCRTDPDGFAASLRTRTLYYSHKTIGHYTSHVYLDDIAPELLDGAPEWDIEWRFDLSPHVQGLIRAWLRDNDVARDAITDDEAGTDYLFTKLLQTKSSGDARKLQAETGVLASVWERIRAVKAETDDLCGQLEAIKDDYAGGGRNRVVVLSNDHGGWRDKHSTMPAVMVDKITAPDCSLLRYEFITAAVRADNGAILGALTWSMTIEQPGDRESRRLTELEVTVAEDHAQTEATVTSATDLYINAWQRFYDQRNSAEKGTAD